ncbi:MAG: hypothetical protein R2712_01815 [Vicinamibacterales bacterium]
MIRERDTHGIPGLPMLFVLLAGIGLGIWMMVTAIQSSAARPWSWPPRWNWWRWRSCLLASSW